MRSWILSILFGLDRPHYQFSLHTFFQALIGSKSKVIVYYATMQPCNRMLHFTPGEPQYSNTLNGVVSLVLFYPTLSLQVPEGPLWLDFQHLLSTFIEIDLRLMRLRCNIICSVRYPRYRCSCNSKFKISQWVESLLFFLRLSILYSEKKTARNSRVVALSYGYNVLLPDNFIGVYEI